MSRPPKGEVAVGEEFTLEIGAMVHGGHCLAYPNGNTAFVRHALAGEVARIRITEVRSKFISIKEHSNVGAQLPARGSFGHVTASNVASC